MCNKLPTNGLYHFVSLYLWLNLATEFSTIKPVLRDLSSKSGLFHNNSINIEKRTTMNHENDLSKQRSPKTWSTVCCDKLFVIDDLTRFNKIAIPNNKFQMASGQGSLWLIESPTIFSSMCSPPLSNICQLYF